MVRSIRPPQSLYCKDIWNNLFNCLIICRKVIDAVNYYEIRYISKELNQDLREIFIDVLYALIGEGIIAASELLEDERSPINYHKIKNKIDDEKLEKSFKKGLIEKIKNWDRLYKINKYYQILTDKNTGIVFLRDKVFAHTDNKGLFQVIKKEIIDNLKEVIMDLYKLHLELLIELSDKNDYKTVMANSQPTAKEYSIQSEQKATLLKNLFRN